MENWKEIFASFGLWSLVEDISDDGDGEGDNLQLTKDGELFVSEIQQELDRAREEGKKECADLFQKVDYYEKLHLIRGSVSLDKHEKRDYYNCKNKIMKLVSI